MLLVFDGCTCASPVCASLVCASPTCAAHMYMYMRAATYDWCFHVAPILRVLGTRATHISTYINAAYVPFEMLVLKVAAMETRVQTHNSNYTRQCSITVLLTLFKNYRLGYSLKLFYRCWSKSLLLLGCDKLFAVLFIFHIFFFLPLLSLLFNLSIGFSTNVQLSMIVCDIRVSHCYCTCRTV